MQYMLRKYIKAIPHGNAKVEPKSDPTQSRDPEAASALSPNAKLPKPKRGVARTNADPPQPDQVQVEKLVIKRDKTGKDSVQPAAKAVDSLIAQIVEGEE